MQHPHISKKRITPGIWLALLGGVLMLLILLSFLIGRYGVSVSEIFRLLASRIVPIAKTWTPEMEAAILRIRLPRILLACLVGGSLSAAGAAYQSVFQNPMAAPDILGASSGAAFGAALGILLGFSSRMITGVAFVLSLVTVGVVYVIGKRAPGKAVVNLILGGIMVSSLFSAGTSFIKLVADPSDQLPAITYWLMGSLSGVKMREVLFAAIPMAVGIIPLLLLGWRMNVLTLGDDEARAMGVNAGALRLTVVLCSTLVTAASVSVSGMIGWVGLVIPHLSRKLVGSDHRFLLPASILMGAAFLLLVDNVSRNLLATEIPLGILTAFVGAPFFMYLMMRKGGM